jgi:hypothetical protein
MTLVVELTYFLDFDDSRNRAALRSVRPAKEVRVLVKQEENRSAPKIGAIGKLSADGKVFDVSVAGQRSHSWNWVWLQEKLSQYP